MRLRVDATPDQGYTLDSTQSSQQYKLDAQPLRAFLTTGCYSRGLCVWSHAMANDWIKMRVDLPDDTDVEHMSDILGTDIPTVVGHLFIFWSYADRNTRDGVLASTDKAIDRRTIPGFAAALREVDWLAGEGRVLNVPNWSRHNDNSAKARALEAEAKRLRRCDKTKECPTSPDTVSDNCPTERPTREEKRREEKKQDNKSGGSVAGVSKKAADLPAGFVRWWSSYPGKRTEKPRCLAIWTGSRPTVSGSKSKLEGMADTICDAVKKQDAGQCHVYDGKHMWPNSSTWLYNQRWEDEADPKPAANSPTADPGGLTPKLGTTER